MGAIGRICLLMLCLLLGTAADTACAAPADQDVSLQRLHGNATPEQLLAGDYDPGRLLSDPRGDVLLPDSADAQWWRVTSRRDMEAGSEPQLVMTSPYLSTVELWRPGATQPLVRSLYGPEFDSRFSTRALVFPLEPGVQAGEAFWLRVSSKGAAPMRVSIEARDDVQRSDLTYVGLRMGILGSTAILLVLAMAMWLRVRDAHYAMFTVAMISIMLYLAVMGGEIRFVPGLADVFASSSAAARLVAGAGIIASNVFLALYMDLAQQLRWAYRTLKVLSIAMCISVLGSLVVSEPMTLIANLVVLLVAATVVVSSITLALRRSRPAIVVMVSWIPLAVFSSLRVLQVIGWWSGPEWADHLQSFGFAIGGLLLMLGTTEQMLHLRREHERVSKIARVDALTGALSRGALDRALADTLASAQQSGTVFSVIFIDVDHFKQVNDEHGHAVGDACLRFIAMRARNHMRSTDVLGRYGGDELLAILPGADSARARAVAVRPLMIDELHLQCTLSLGAAQWRPGERIEDVLIRADNALYRSKAAGRNCVHVAPGDALATEEMCV